MEIRDIMDKLDWMDSMLEQRFLPDAGEVPLLEGIEEKEDIVVSIYNLKTEAGVIRKGDVFRVIEEFMLPITDNHGVIIEHTPAIIGIRLCDNKKFLLYRDTVRSIP